MFSHFSSAGVSSCRRRSDAKSTRQSECAGFNAQLGHSKQAAVDWALFLLQSDLGSSELQSECAYISQGQSVIKLRD